MRISYETAAKKLEYAAPDVINYSDVHPHDPKKVIAFSAPAAAVPHPSMRSRHRRMARRALRMQKLLVAYPRYACVALLALFLYLRIAVFPESGAAGLGALWIGAYLLAGLSFVFARRLKASGQ